MLPTARAPLAHTNTNRSLANRQHAAGAALNQQRQQWDARLASFQRGLDHVMHCHAGDACGSALCHATRRLMRNYATHDCTNAPGSSSSNAATASPCKVCTLWGYILTTRHTPSSSVGRGHRHTGVGSVGDYHSLPSISCGIASTRRVRTPAPRRVTITPDLAKAMAKRV